MLPTWMDDVLEHYQHTQITLPDFDPDIELLLEID